MTPMHVAIYLADAMMGAVFFFAGHVWGDAIFGAITAIVRGGS